MHTVRRRTLLATLATALVAALLPSAAQAHGHPTPPPPPEAPADYTLVYVYPKIDPSKPASWENSGRQTLIIVSNGHRWVDRFDASVLPAEVCGDGWGVQEDMVRLRQSEIPAVVERATNTGVLGWPQLVNWRHRDLSRYVTVPECTPTSPSEPIDPPVQPTDPPVQPTDPPVQPTEPPAEPEDTRPVVTPPTEVSTAQPAVPVAAAPTFAG